MFLIGFDGFHYIDVISAQKHAVLSTGGLAINMNALRLKGQKISKNHLRHIVFSWCFCLIIFSQCYYIYISKL